MSLNDCEWLLVSGPDDVYYETSCGKAFVMTDGSPKENDMCFCCYCGKPLIEIDDSMRTANDVFKRIYPFLA